MTRTPVEIHLLAAERRLVESLALRPVTLPPSLAQARGLWKDAPVTIETRAYEGDSVARVRLALVSGLHLSVGSLLALPRPNRTVPVLAADVAWLGAQRETIVTLDLVPMRIGPDPDADEEAIGARLPGADGIQAGDDPPPWYRAWASQHGRHLRVGAGRLEQALGTIDGYVACWIALDQAAVPEPQLAAATRDRQQAYTAARRTDARVLDLLGTMFGRAWADDYVATVLLPDMLSP